MKFEHTEDRRMLSDTFGRFIKERYTFEAREKILKSKQGYHPELWHHIGELGILGLLFSEDSGGYGGSGFDISVVFENIGLGLLVEPVLSSAVLFGGILAQAGDERQKSLINDIISGECIGCLAYDEPHAHYQLEYVETTATTNDDGWVINGHKSVVADAGITDKIIISARTSGEVQDKSGISLFLLNKNHAGMKIESYPTIDGMQAAEVLCNEVFVPKSALIGTLDSGFEILENAIGSGVLALCAEAIGVMDYIKDSTVEYLRTRKQFNIPIGSFQALQHRMADVLLEIEQARSAVIHAADCLDKDRLTREKALSAAKYTIGSIGTFVAEEAIQLHGGIGMTWELPLSHYAKRLIMINHILGDDDYHLQRYISLNY